MDYHFEREIRLIEETEYKGLYSWALQEFNDKSEKVGSEQIPWQWDLCFTASELRHIYSIGKESSYFFDDKDLEKENNEPVREFEVIYAILNSGICRDGKWLEHNTSYSMFGTNRKLKDFTLRISKLKDNDDKEYCNLWGSLSYTTEIDFRNETSNDVVEIFLFLTPNKFNKIVQLINEKKVDIFEITLGRVSGFYSEWSPSISTRNIKVLTKGVKIISPDNCEISPPTLGSVDSFNISITQRNIINIKQDLGRIDVDKLFEEPDDYEQDVVVTKEYIESQPDENSLIIAQLGRNEITFSKLRNLLWIILFVLLLILIK